MAFSRDESAWGRLVREGFITLLSRLAAPHAEPALVVLVSDGDLSGLVADLRSLGLAAPGGRRVVTLTGAELGRFLETAGCPDSLDPDSPDPRGGPPGLVIVNGLAEIAGSRRQRAAGVFLDGLCSRRISACLTVSRTAFTAGFEPTLESRLSAGLVIHVPVRPTAAATTGTTGSVARIVRHTARRYGMAPTVLTGSGRSRSAVEVRNLAMYLARRLTGRSFGSIGKAFGGRDHTTVMRGIRGVEERIAADASFATDVERLVEDTAGPASPARRRPTG